MKLLLFKNKLIFEAISLNSFTMLENDHVKRRNRIKKMNKLVLYAFHKLK